MHSVRATLEDVCIDHCTPERILVIKEAAKNNPHATLLSKRAYDFDKHKYSVCTYIYVLCSTQRCVTGLSLPHYELNSGHRGSLLEPM